MRIVGGTAKGRRLYTIKGLLIRPTSDKVREAIFNILGIDFHYKRVLDLFAGTGAMGIEALSRGAESAAFIDNNASAIRIIKKNLDICGLIERDNVIKMDVIKALQPSTFMLGKGFDLIFIDPPYEAGLTGRVLEMIDKNKILADGGIVVSEISKRTVGWAVPTKNIGNNKNGGHSPPYYRLCKFDTRQYGDTVVEFYKNKEG